MKIKKYLNPSSSILKINNNKYSYTKPLNNVIVDEYGNLLDPNVPSAKGSIQLPEVIVTTRNPRKYSSAYDKYLGFKDILYNLSRHVMLRGHSWGIGDGTEKISLPSDSISNEPFEGIAQATYLLPRDIQDTKFKDAGYTRNDGDYGLVRKAVGNKHVPVYQKRPDDISRNKLIPIGNINDIWLGKEEAELVHPGSYPTTIYIDPETDDLYQKGWDYNNYGSSDKGEGASEYYTGLKKHAADVLDMIGSPVVVTTGFSKIGNINNLDDYRRIMLNDYGILNSYKKKYRHLEKKINKLLFLKNI